MGFAKSENNETKVVKKYYYTSAMAQYDTKSTLSLFIFG